MSLSNYDFDKSFNLEDEANDGEENTGQQWLLERFQAAGFNPGLGVCNYIAIRGMLENFMGEENAFNLLIAYIKKNSTEEICLKSKWVNEFYAKFQNPDEQELEKKRLTEDELLSLSMVEFFQEGDIIQNPECYQNLIKKLLSIDLDNENPISPNETGKLVTLLQKYKYKSKVEYKSEIVEVKSGHHSCICNEKKIETYFETFTTILKEEKSLPSIALILENSNHTICCLFMNEKWTVIDANNLDNEEDDLFENILLTLSQSLNAVFTAHLFVAQDHLQIAQKCIAKWLALPKLKDILMVTDTNVNFKDDNNATLLFIASQQDQDDLVKVLIEKKANVDQETKDDGTTPLQIAIQNNSYNVIKLLIESKASPTKRAMDGTSPLYVAVQSNNLNAVKMLIDKKADIEAQSNNVSPLALSCSTGNLTMVKLLIDCKADIHKKIKSKSLVEIANEFKQSQVVTFFQPSVSSIKMEGLKQESTPFSDVDSETNDTLSHSQN